MLYSVIVDENILPIMLTDEKNTLLIRADSIDITEKNNYWYKIITEQKNLQLFLQGKSSINTLFNDKVIKSNVINGELFDICNVTLPKLKNQFLEINYYRYNQ